MSLEWARARLLQHSEALRRLCEAQVQLRAQQQASQRRKRHAAAVAGLPRDVSPRLRDGVTEKGQVLKFEQPGRRRRA